MKVRDVRLGEHYELRVWLKPVRPVRQNCGSVIFTGGIGFAGCWVRRTVLVVERIGQHFICESVQWKCMGRDMDSLKCTWVKLVVREHVYARNLISNGLP